MLRLGTPDFSPACVMFSLCPLCSLCETFIFLLKTCRTKVRRSQKSSLRARRFFKTCQLKSWRSQKTSLCGLCANPFSFPRRSQPSAQRRSSTTIWEIGIITSSIIWPKAKRSSPGERKGRQRFCSGCSISCGAVQKAK